MALLRKLLLPVILILLAYTFWQSASIKQIAAGVAIFLFGMLALEDGFQYFTGGFLETFLRRSTNSLWKSLSFGVVTTSLMQSSSLVSVLTISFLSAGLVDLAAGIGIIFGANIGTTTGAWLLAAFGLKIKLSTLAMPILTFGIILVFQKSKSLKGLGWVLAGIGFLFLGIHNMKEGFEAFRGSLDLAAYAMPGLKGVLIFSVLGIAATVIMQSSHATLVLIITALASQQITYENALALAIGANVGTTVTAIIGSLSANIAGKRLAGAHLVFNLVTAFVAIYFMPKFMIATDWISLNTGIADDNYTLKLAVFHTLFNLTGVILMAPLIRLLVIVLEKILPNVQQRLKQPKYLNNSALDTPQATLEVVRKESIRLYDLSLKVIANAIGWRKPELLGKANPDDNTPFIHKDIDKAYNTRIKFIFSAIIEFVITARENLTGSYAENIQVYSKGVKELARTIKATKHLQKNLLVYIVSDNKDMNQSYNKLRNMIALVVRKIEQNRAIADPTEAMLNLDHLLLKIEDKGKIMS